MRGAAVIAALLLAAPASALKTEKIRAVSPKGLGGSIEVVSGQLLVRFSSGTTLPDEASIVGQSGAAIGEQLPSGWTLVRLSSGMPVDTGIRMLSSLHGVLSVAPDHAYRPVKVPDDPSFPLQTSFGQMDMPAAWDYETGSTSKVTIAIIDTGIEGTHPDLHPKLIDVSTPSIASQFFDPDNSGQQHQDSLPVAACEHGTETSGIAGAAANNGTGIAGMSWGAQLISLRVFNSADCNSDCSDAAGHSCVTDDVTVDKAINYAKNTLQNSGAAGHVVVSMSLGAAGAVCSSGDGTLGAGILQTDIDNAVAAGIPFAIAAGNEGATTGMNNPAPTGIDEPANCAGQGTSPVGIMPVGSVNGSDGISWFSNGGPELANHGVVAPGENVETTTINGNYTSGATGTSFSTPHVAGLMALILSAKQATTPAQIETDIRGGAQSVGASSTMQGAGRADGFRTLRLLIDGTLATFTGDQKAIAFPNPFHVSQQGDVTITIPASLQGSSPSIKIYNTAGEFVRQLSGQTWDGKNSDGNYVASGTYIFEVSTSAGHTMGRLAVIR